MKIFLTYSRSTQEKVLSLVKDLEALDHTVWFDHDLSGGQSWWNNILSQIRNCDIYIFAIAKDAIDSTACLRELKYAEALNKTPLPVLMNKDVSMAMVPRYLSNVQYVDYSNADDKNAVFALIKAINNLPPSPQLPDPLPAPPEVPISYLDTLKEKVDAPDLNKNDQIALVRELSNKLNDPQVDQGDIRALLTRLRKHDDLLASVALEIDELLSKTTPSASQPVAKTAPQATQKTSNAPLQNPRAATKSTQPLPQQPVQTPAVPSSGWSTGIMVVLILATLIIPFIGIVAGIVGITSKHNRNSGIVLLVIGLFMMIIYAATLSGW